MAHATENRTAHLLSVHIHTTQPASESWMRVIPPYNHFRSASLFEHIQHFRLENVIHRFDRDCRTCLRHGKDVDAGDLLLSAAQRQGIWKRKEETYSVVIHKLAQHETHDFHRDTCSTMFQHLYISMTTVCQQEAIRRCITLSRAKDDMCTVSPLHDQLLAVYSCLSRGQ